MKKVMISYSHAQKRDALALREALQSSSSSTSVWIDAEDMIVGADVSCQMHSAVSDADAVVILLSPEYVNSPSCMFEARLCRALSKPVIPAVVRGTWPFGSDEIGTVLGDGTLRIQSHSTEELHSQIVNSLAQISAPIPIPTQGSGVGVVERDKQRLDGGQGAGSPAQEEALELIEREGLTVHDLRNMRRLMHTSSQALQDALTTENLTLGGRLALMNLANNTPATPKQKSVGR